MNDTEHDKLIREAACAALEALRGQAIRDNTEDRAEGPTDAGDCYAYIAGTADRALASLRAAAPAAPSEPQAHAPGPLRNFPHVPLREQFSMLAEILEHHEGPVTFEGNALADLVALLRAVPSDLREPAPSAPAPEPVAPTLNAFRACRDTSGVLWDLCVLESDAQAAIDAAYERGRRDAHGAGSAK